jgi:hypothetical protein
VRLLARFCGRFTRRRRAIHRLREELVQADLLRLEVRNATILAHELVASLAYVGLILELRDDDTAKALDYCNDARSRLDAYLARVRHLGFRSAPNIDELLAPLGRT